MRAWAKGLVGGVCAAVLLGGCGAWAAGTALDPDWIKAMVRVEAGHDQTAYATDPMQVNNPADWAAAKARLGLKPGVAPGPELGIEAGLERLNAEAWQVDASGRRVRFRGWEAATRRYNGGGDPQYLEKVKQAYQDIKAGR